MPVRSPEYMQARHDDIVEAAISCMLRLGPAKVSMSDICEQAGVSRGAFYVHFSSKDEVLSAVIGRLRDSMIKESRFSTPGELRDVLYAHVRRHDLRARSQMAVVELELLLAARDNPALSQSLSTAFKQRHSQFEAGLAALAAEQHFLPGVDPSQAAELILSFLSGEVVGSLASTAPSAIKLAAIDLMLAAILKPGSLSAVPLSHDPQATHAQLADASLA